MTPQILKAEILSILNDIVFEYNGKSACINPYSTSKFEVGFGEVSKVYDDIDCLMSDPIYDGKCLNDIADKIIIF